MFVDIAKINIKAGNGGNGAVAFHREKYVAAGGPDGGDGGRGGNIVFQADDSLATLSDFRYKRKYKAPSGEDGRGARQNGKKGQDLIIRVPRGTVIREVTSGTIMADMSTDEPFIAAKGGNVGKSSLLSVVIEAKPIIGDYHFTTIIPVLGVVTMGPEQSFVMADIPGLIEGAADGVGLGHEFLKHIERCRMLVHVVDVAGSEGRDPKEDFEKINEELVKFNPELAKCPQIVAGNKIDLATDEQLEDFKSFIEKKGLPYFPIVAPIKYGTKELINAVAEKLSTLPPVKKYEAEEIPLSVLESKKNNGFKVTVNDGAYSVEADWLYRILSKTDLDDYASLQYFQTVLKSSGIIDELVKQGIQEGDTVSIYDLEFDYIP